MTAGPKYIEEVSGIRYGLNIDGMIKSNKKDKAKPKTKQKWHQTAKH